MAITYIGERGAGSDGTTSSTSATIAVTVNTVPNNHLILILAGHNTSATVSSITDTKGNTWTVDGNAQSTTFSDDWVMIASSPNGTPLTTADTISVSLSGTLNRRVWWLEEFAGIFVGAANGSNSTSGNSSPIGSGSSTPAASGDLSVCGICVTAPSATHTISSFNATSTVGTYLAFTTGETVAGTSAWKDCLATYQTGCSAAAQEEFYTSSTGTDYLAVIALYKPLVVVASPPVIVNQQQLVRASRW